MDGIAGEEKGGEVGVTSVGMAEVEWSRSG